MDSYTPSLESIELPAVPATSSTRTPHVVIINWVTSTWVEIPRLFFFVAKLQSLSETEPEENLVELSQNKAQNESAGWC